MRKITNKLTKLECQQSLYHLHELLVDESQAARNALALDLPPDKRIPARLMREARRVAVVLDALTGHRSQAVLQRYQEERRRPASERP